MTNGLGRDPLTIKAWAAVGDALVESGAMSGEGLSGISPEAAHARVRELRADLDKLSETHPRRKEIIDEIIAVTNAARSAR